MAAQIKTAQNVAKAGSYYEKTGLNEPSNPPACHVIVNLIAAFFIAPLGHWLARPSDLKSKSFLATLGAFVIGWVLSWFYIGYLLVVAAWIWASFVCVVSEKNRVDLDPPEDTKAASDADRV